MKDIAAEFWVLRECGRGSMDGAQRDGAEFSWNCGRALNRRAASETCSEMRLGTVGKAMACQKAAGTAGEFRRSWPGFEELLQPSPLGGLGLWQLGCPGRCRRIFCGRCPIFGGQKLQVFWAGVLWVFVKAGVCRDFASRVEGLTVKV